MLPSIIVKVLSNPVVSSALLVAFIYSAFNWRWAEFKLDQAELLQERAELQTRTYKQSLEKIEQLHRIELDKARSNVLEAKRDLEFAVKEERRKANEQIKAANATADALIRRLRQQPTDAGSTSSGASTDSSATGNSAFTAGSNAAVLSAEAEFLVGEAERAEVIRLELLACYNQYDQAREVLQKLQQK